MNIYSSSYNPNGLRCWITVDGKSIEVDDLSVWFEGVDVMAIENPRAWAKATVDNVFDVINANAAVEDDDNPGVEMTAEDADEMENGLRLWIRHYQREAIVAAAQTMSRSEQIAAWEAQAAKVAALRSALNAADDDEAAASAQYAYHVAQGSLNDMDAAGYTPRRWGTGLVARWETGDETPEQLDIYNSAEWGTGM